MTERLARIYPHAEIVAIDITPRIGRLYRGPAENVSFLQTTVQEMAAQRRAQFDLVILADVIHHVPTDLRKTLFAAAKTALAKDGAFIFKDWERAANLIHALCYASDRWLTGDRVRYINVLEMCQALTSIFGQSAIAEKAHISRGVTTSPFLFMHDNPPATRNVVVASADLKTRSSPDKGRDVRMVTPVVSFLNQFASASLLKHEWLCPNMIARDATTVCRGDPRTCNCAAPSLLAAIARLRMRWLARFKTESFRAARLLIGGICRAPRRAHLETAWMAHFLHIPPYRADT